MKAKKLNLLGVIMAAALVVGGITGCSDTKTSKEVSVQSTIESAESAEESVGNGEFSDFKGKDLDGNAVDASILKQNKITVLNFWFNGCSACVSEMPDLEKFNKELKEKNAEIVGVNVETMGGDKIVEEAKEILKKQGATYKNIMITEGDKAVDYMNDIMAFPTTILVDQNGNIIGEPVCGSLDEKMMAKLMEQIDQVTGSEK